MTRVGFSRRNTSKATHCAQSEFVSLDIRDESPPDTKYDFTDFLNCDITLGVKTRPERHKNGDKNDFICSEPVIAGKCEGTAVEAEVNLFDLLNGVQVEICDQKPTDFSEYLRTCNDSKKMKLKENSETKVGALLSDRLSFSIEEWDRLPHNSCGKAALPACNLSLNDFTIPECTVGENLKNVNVPVEPSGKKINGSSESDFSLSDILSSISIDDGNHPTSKSLHEPSLCLQDFNATGEMKHTDPNVRNEEIRHVPNCVSSFDFSDADLDKLTSQRDITVSEVLDNDKYSRSYIAENKQLSLACINVQDLIEDTSSHNANSLGSSLESRKSNGFSFFCEQTENQLTFSQMLDDNRNINKANRSDSCSDQDSICMMDLYNSIQSSTESTTTSETNSSLSDEIEKACTLQNSTFDEDDQVIAIDLSTCIKSFEDNSSFKPQEISQSDVTNLILESSTKQDLHSNKCHSMPLKSTVTPRALRKKSQQSLFAKALSCKSKTDPTLVHQVANIKTELFNKVFGRPTAIEGKVYTPCVETVSYSDKAVIQWKGCRTFEPTVS